MPELDKPKTTPAPGIYPNIDFSEYLAWPLLSQSTLKEGRQSMAHLKAAMDGERDKAPTDDMVLGTALHTAFLEPELMADQVVKWKGGTRNGKAWDAFKSEHSGKVILTPVMHEKLIGMTRALRNNKHIRQWLGKIEHTEVAAVGDVCGVRMKGRCDALTPDPLIDLKKVNSYAAQDLQRHAYRFGYHIQGAIYCKLYNRERFWLATVEDTAPFDVVVYELSESMLRRGEIEANDLLERYAECMETGHWPGRGEEIVTLDEPGWLAECEEETPLKIS